MRERRRLRQEAWTLIELLIVISIIVVLVSLTLSAVMYFLYKPAEVRARHEMSQMDGAVQQFKTKYDVDYVPSQIKIARNYASYNLNVALDRDSVDYLTKTIGRNSPNFTKKWQSPGPTGGILWTPAMQVGDYEILEGHQCLVFFLGGLCTQSGGQFNPVGFSTDASNPDVPPAKGSGVGPFHDFNPNRLQVPPNKKFFPAYLDSYSPHPNGITQYYAYFSSYKKDNGYNRYRTDGSLTFPTSGPASTAPIMSDCVSLGLWPYASQPPGTQGGAPSYLRSKDWQIICAGQDGAFGPGTDPTSPTPYYWNKNTFGQLISTPGADDQSNFAYGKMQYGE
jgi:general secretion pathway protein G